VNPSLGFSDTAFRRYYDHVLAYADFKEASKSEDKHRLYLGLLDGPLYPKAVVDYFKGLLMDQIYVLCADLGKQPPECGAMPLMMQGDPFAVEEVSVA
jgi:hypothetical protein